MIHDNVAELKLSRLSNLQGADLQPRGHLLQHGNVERGQARLNSGCANCELIIIPHFSFYLTVVAHKSYSNAQLRIHGYNLKDVREI